MVHQDLCIEDLHEALIPKGNDGDALVGADLTEYRSVLGKLNWLQSRIDEGQITHLICARLKYDLYDFLGGVLGCFLFFFLWKRPKNTAGTD